MNNKEKVLGTVIKLESENFMGAIFLPKGHPYYRKTVEELHEDPLFQNLSIYHMEPVEEFHRTKNMAKDLADNDWLMRFYISDSVNDKKDEAVAQKILDEKIWELTKIWVSTERKKND